MRHIETKEYLNTGLFEVVMTHPFRILHLKDTHYRYDIFNKENACWYDTRYVALSRAKGELHPALRSTEEVIESIPKDIAEKLLFHLELFSHKQVGNGIFNEGPVRPGDMPLPYRRRVSK